MADAVATVVPNPGVELTIVLNYDSGQVWTVDFAGTEQREGREPTVSIQGCEYAKASLSRLVRGLEDPTCWTVAGTDRQRIARCYGACISGDVNPLVYLPPTVRPPPNRPTVLVKPMAPFKHAPAVLDAILSANLGEGRRGQVFVMWQPNAPENPYLVENLNTLEAMSTSMAKLNHQLKVKRDEALLLRRDLARWAAEEEEAAAERPEGGGRIRLTKAGKADRRYKPN